MPGFGRASLAAKLAIEDYQIIGEALHATEMVEWERALTLMDGIDDPLAQKLFEWLVLVQDRDKADFDRLAAFIIANPDWPRLRDLQELAESRLTDSVDRAVVRRLFEQREPLTTRGRIRWAQALFAAERNEEAIEQIKRSWTRGTFTKKEENSFLERHGTYLHQDDHDARLHGLLWERRWAEAKRMLPKVSEGLASLAKARLVLQQRDPGVDRAIAAVPDAYASDLGLRYDRIRWRRQKQKHSDAIDLLLEPVEQLESADRWWFERSYQVRRAIDRGEFDLAYQIVSRHGQEKGSDYAEAEWLAGWLALRFNNNPQMAYRHFVRLYDRVIYPVRQARAAYWAGRAASAQQDQAGATAWYRRAASHHHTYYGQIAAGELREDLRVGRPVQPTTSDRVSFDSMEITSVARMLIAAGANRHLDDFLEALSDKAESAADISMITELAVAGGRPNLLARVGRRAAFRGQVYHPAAYPVPRISGLLEPDASNVDAALLLGLARQESMFQTGAKSKAGAQGLLQLLPSTARNVARQLGLEFDQDQLVGDPNYNAMLGGHYLGTLLERFEGEPALALAAYNAGPLRVNRWMEKHGDPREGSSHDLIDWVELIPFEETRNYVQRVMEGFHVYRTRLAEDDVALLDFPGSDVLFPPRIPERRPSVGAAVARDDEASAVPSHQPVFRPSGPGQNSEVRIAEGNALRDSEAADPVQENHRPASFSDHQSHRVAAGEREAGGAFQSLD